MLVILFISQYNVIYTYCTIVKNTKLSAKDPLTRKLISYLLPTTFCCIQCIEKMVFSHSPRFFFSSCLMIVMIIFVLGWPIERIFLCCCKVKYGIKKSITFGGRLIVLATAIWQTHYVMSLSSLYILSVLSSHQARKKAWLFDSALKN